MVEPVNQIYTSGRQTVGKAAIIGSDDDDNAIYKHMSKH